MNNYTWYFNDELLYSDGIEIDPSNMYLAVDHQSVTFQRLIVADVAGVYRSVLNTSVGVKIVNIQLNVEGRCSCWPSRMQTLSPSLSPSLTLSYILLSVL